jgi:pimeloyl-ACP methyl ester carboxylesterase
MKNAIRNGVRLAYQESGSGSSSVLLVHGWGGDHTYLERQEVHLREAYRVVNVDLRGHGASESSQDEYTMELYADDLAWLCEELKLSHPFVVGHSMGGMVALQLAAKHPALPSAIVLIDSLVLPSQALMDSFKPLREAMLGPEYAAAFQQTMLSLLLPSDHDGIREKILDPTKLPQQHVLASSLDAHFRNDFTEAAARQCRIPAAYIGSAHPLGNTEAFQRLTPQLQIAQTLGSGHFSPLQVPSQINAMLDTFIAADFVNRCK